MSSSSSCCQLLTQLVPVLHERELLPAVMSMLLSHSAFLPTLLAETLTPNKECLVSLLHSMVSTDTTQCDSKHVAALLGAYTATLNKTDQQLLSVMHMYEKAGCSMQDYRPYLWGPAAVSHQTYLRDVGPSLGKQPSMEQVMEILQPDTLWASALQFPLRRRPQGLQVDGGDDEVKGLAGSEGYDPAFVLPLFAHLLGPECVANCRVFVERHCLAYTLCALSSHDEGMRRLAYHVLARFYQQLEGARRFSEKEQVTSLLECVKNSLDRPNEKLACIITVFLAKLTTVILKPDDPLYQVLNAFLLLKPNMDIMNVPEFYKLFNSSSQEYKQERSWILQLLIDGLRETGDFRIFEKRYTFKLLLSFYNCDMSDLHCKAKVLDILSKAVNIRTVASAMVKEGGLLQWLASSQGSDVPASHASKIVGLYTGLWWTLLGDDARCLPIVFTNQMLLALLQISSCFSFPSATLLSKYLQCVASVTVHLARTREHHRQTSGVVICTLQCSIDTDVPNLMQHYLKHARAENKYDDRASEDVDNFERSLVSDKFDTDTELTEEDVDSSAVSTWKKDCVEALVKIIAHSSVNQDVKQSQKFGLILGWCLAQINQGTVALKLEKGLLEWLDNCLKHSPQVGQIFVEKSEEAKLLLALLVNLYYQETTEEMAAKRAVLNRVFMQLVDFAMKSEVDVEDVSMFGDIVRGEVFKRNAKSLRRLSEKEASSRLGLMFQELVFGCRVPVHSV